MDVQQFPAESNKLFLSASPAFALLEGAVAADDLAWVVIRQATQSDNMKRADMYTKRETKYGTDQAGIVDSVSRVYNENTLRRQMYEVYLTLKDMGNFTLAGKPIFPKFPVKDMPQKEFEVIWGELRPEFAAAIHERVLDQNPDWGDRQGE